MSFSRIFPPRFCLSCGNNSQILFNSHAHKAGGSFFRASVPSSWFSSYSAMTAEESGVYFEVKGSAGVITLNRPKALNSLNLTMVRLIFPQLKKWESDRSVSHVIIKGSGDKAFCAGGDVLEIWDNDEKKIMNRHNFFREEYILNYKIGTYKKPYIALIDGITMGGGVGLSVHGKYRLCTEKTMFAMPETAIGLFPDVGGGHFLPRLKGKLGVYLALTGYRLKGADNLHAGIATHFIPRDKLIDLEEALTSSSSGSQYSPNDIDLIISRASTTSSTSSSSDLPPFSLEPHFRSIDKHFGGSTVEAIFESLQADAKSDEWAAKQLATLQKMSPISMKISLRQLIEGAQLSLEDCLKMEYRLSQRCIIDHDFREGVRAVLKDKDQNPKWKPPTIYDITPGHVDWYFTRLPARGNDRELDVTGGDLDTGGPGSSL